MSKNLRNRLTTALMDYNKMPTKICVADLADYLIEVIDELHTEGSMKDIIIELIGKIMEDDSIRFVDQAVRRSINIVKGA